MKAYLKNIIIIGDGDEKRILTFSDGLNIITGDSKTGKSALIEIVDYCLFSQRCTVPVGKVMSFASIFSIVLQVDNKIIVLGRENKPSSKSFISVEYDEKFSPEDLVDRHYFEKCTARQKSDVQRDFEQHLGLSVESTDLPEDDSSIRKGKASIRNAVSLMFQHQNLVANKHSIFYRFDDFLKRNSVIDQLPIFLGWFNNKYYRLMLRREQLKRDIIKLEKEENKHKLSIDETKNKILSPLKSYYQALNLKLPDENLSIIALKSLAKNLPEVPINSEQNSKLAEQKKALLDEQDTLYKSLVEKNKILGFLEDSEKESEDYSKIMMEMQSISSISEDREVDRAICCPLCDSEVKSVTTTLALVSESRKNLYAELSRVGKYASDVSKSYNSYLLERDKIKQRMNQISSKLGYLNKLMSAKKNENIRDKLNQLKGRMEVILELELSTIQGKPKDTILLDMKKELELIEGQLLEFPIDKKMSEANTIMQETMNYLKDKFDFEDELRNGQMKFDIRTFSFHYEWQGKNLRLSEMGSGANWLACHLALFLSILKLIAINDSKIPTILFLDQPSQVYFPKASKIFSSENSEELRSNEEDDDRIDENILQVVKIFQTIKDFLNDLKKEYSLDYIPQVIVLEHADEPQFNEFVRYRWYSKGPKLI
ncbi:DUF3732 domain-containing protein [Vibrio metoecus]